VYFYWGGLVGVLHQNPPGDEEENESFNQFVFSGRVGFLIGLSRWAALDLGARVNLIVDTSFEDALKRESGNDDVTSDTDPKLLEAPIGYLGMQFFL